MARRPDVLDAPTTLAPLDEDPEVIAARRAEADACDARDRAQEAARACRTVLAATVGEGDPRTVLRARVRLPQLEQVALETDLAYQDAAAHARTVEREAMAARVPAARARVRALVRQFYEVIDEQAVPRMLALREAIATENAHLGRPLIPVGELLWPEIMGPAPGDSLLELRRRLLQQGGGSTRPLFLSWRNLAAPCTLVAKFLALEVPRPTAFGKLQALTAGARLVASELA